VQISVDLVVANPEKVSGNRRKVSYILNDQDDSHFGIFLEMFLPGERPHIRLIQRRWIFASFMGE
jgi:hypothetical protein